MLCAYKCIESVSNDEGIWMTQSIGQPLALLGGLTLVLLSVGCGGGGGGDDPPEVLLGTTSITADLTGSGGADLVSIEIELGWFDQDFVTFTATPPLTGTEDGEEFETLAGSNTVVDEHFARLTDGIDGRVALAHRGLPGGASASNSEVESVALLSKHPSLLGPDLEGARITRCVLSLTTINVTTGNPFHWDFTGVVTYFGVVQD